MAASRTPAGPKSPGTAATFKGTIHGSSARPPPMPRRPGRRLQQQQQQQQQQQRYFGRMSSNVTDHLKKIVPSHAFHPSLLRLPVPSYHRKASSISAYLESQVRPPPQPRRPYTAPDVYFGRRASNVTDHLRYIPPSHLGMDAHSKSLPYFGRLATSVTDPSKYDIEEAADGDAVDHITSHWSAGSRPSSARLPVAPQHVSTEVLFHALSARGDRPSGSGRQPTNIGSLLKHQSGHFHGDPSAHAEHEQKVPTISQSAVPQCNVEACSKQNKIKSSSGIAPTFCSPRPGNKHVDEDSHEATTKHGQISMRAGVQRPVTAPAAESTSKRTRHSSTHNTQQHFPSPRVVASPRPASARGSAASPRPTSARGSVASEKHALRNKQQNMIEASPRRKASIEETVNAKRNVPEISCNATNDHEAGAREELQEATQMAEEEMMTENGQRMTSGGEGGQSTQCDDNSSDMSEQVGSEKLELVRQWVQQEDQPHFRHAAAAATAAPWPPNCKGLDKVVDHGRRATSITKYNIW